MRTLLIFGETDQIITEHDFQIIPRIGEKIEYDKKLFKVKDIIHKPNQIGLIVDEVNLDEQDYTVIWG